MEQNYRKALRRRVLKGIAWLDQHGPAHWWQRTDLNSLNIASEDWCVLGQVFDPDLHPPAARSYNYNGYDYILGIGSLGCEGMERHGFTPDLNVPHTGGRTWEQRAADLTSVWVKELDKIQTDRGMT